jgi:tRNA threonylcarbamoyladenosine biosynthesis protein TsaB
MKSNLLAVDSSSRVLSIAVRHSSGKQSEINLKETFKHSEQMIEAIALVLKRVRVRKDEIDEFLWGLGPGSFTGLRIGLAALKGFCVSLRKKVYGASSLDFIAMGCNVNVGHLIVCVDAHRDRIYASQYECSGRNITKLQRESLLRVEDLARWVKKDSALTGDAIQKYGNRLQAILTSKVKMLDPSFWYPRASALIRLRESHESWLTPLKLKTMVPSYLRLSEAEEKAQG